MTQGSEAAQQGDSTGGVIPYKNVPALIGYYCGVFSIIPFMGIAASIPAIFLGVWGLRQYKANPVISGRVHAWIGIVLGTLMTLVWGGLIIMMFVAAAASAA